MKKVRMFASLGLLSAVVGGAFFIPFPSSVMCSFELQPRNSESVYIEVAGKVKKILVEPGQQVAANEVLIELSNLDLKIEIARLQGEYASTLEELHMLEEITSSDETAVLRLAAVRESLRTTDEQLEKKLHDAERLMVKSPIAGVVIPAPPKREPVSEERVQLGAWTGSPLEKHNLGATLSPEGQHNLLCQIGDPNSWDAILVIDQGDLDLVLEGQEVRLMFEESSNHVFISHISGIADDKIEGLSPRLSSTSGGSVPAQADQEGVVRPLTTSYKASVPLDNSQDMFRNGLIGQARIKTRPRTLASRLGRYLRRTFSFDL